MNAQAVLNSQQGDYDIVRISAAATLGLYQRHVRATANTASGSYTITLPSVAESAGVEFSITATIANAKVVTLADQNDSEDWAADLLLDTDGDSVTLKSDGNRWVVVENSIAV